MSFCNLESVANLVYHVLTVSGELMIKITEISSFLVVRMHKSDLIELKFGTISFLVKYHCQFSPANFTYPSPLPDNLIFKNLSLSLQCSKDYNL